MRSEFLAGVVGTYLVVRILVISGWAEGWGILKKERPVCVQCPTNPIPEGANVLFDETKSTWTYARSIFIDLVVGLVMNRYEHTESKRKKKGGGSWSIVWTQGRVWDGPGGQNFCGGFTRETQVDDVFGQGNDVAVVRVYWSWIHMWLMALYRYPTCMMHTGMVISWVWIGNNRVDLSSAGCSGGF